MANLILQTPNAFSIGTDLSCSLTDPVAGINRNLDEFGHLEEFRATAIDKEIEIVPISRGGVHLYRTLWAGAEIEIKWSKVYGALQYFWAALQNNYFDLHSFTSFLANASVLNRDGTIDEFNFTACEPSKPNFGDFAGTKPVDNTLKLRCGRFSMLGANAPQPGASPLSFI